MAHLGSILSFVVGHLLLCRGAGPQRMGASGRRRGWVPRRLCAQLHAHQPKPAIKTQSSWSGSDAQPCTAAAASDRAFVCPLGPAPRPTGPLLRHRPGTRCSAHLSRHPFAQRHVPLSRHHSRPPQPPWAGAPARSAAARATSRPHAVRCGCLAHRTALACAAQQRLCVQWAQALTLAAGGRGMKASSLH